MKRIWKADTIGDTSSNSGKLFQRFSDHGLISEQAWCWHRDQRSDQKNLQKLPKDIKRKTEKRLNMTTKRCKMQQSNHKVTLVQRDHTQPDENQPKRDTER